MSMMMIRVIRMLKMISNLHDLIRDKEFPKLVRLGH